MKSLSSNALVFTVGTIIIAVFSALFYIDVHRRVDVGDAKVIGTVTFKKRVAQRRYSRQVVWEDLERTEPIYNNDTIRTGDRSEAVVRINDGTEFTLNENSMVLLALGGEGLDLEFNQGSITAKRDELSGEPIGKVRIKAGGASVSFDKSTVNISKGKDDNINLVVDKGSAVVTTNAGEKTVAEDYRATVLLKTAAVSVEKQKLVLLSPPSGSVFPAKGPEAPIGFSWKKLPEEGDYSIDIEPQDTAAGGNISRKTAGNSLIIPLRSGSYKWKVHYKSRSGQEETSETRSFIILPYETIAAISPADNAVYFYKNKPPLVHFKWSPSSAASGYVLSIYNDAELKSKFTEIGTLSTAVSLDTIPEGTWYWKVDASSGISGVGTVASSETRKMSIAKRSALPPPEPLVPRPGMRFWKKAVLEKPIHFSWRNDPEISIAEITIAWDPEFTKIFHRETKKASFLSLKKDIPIGNYFWKVRGVMDDTTYTEHSPAWNFTVTEEVLLELLSPVDRQIIVPQDEDDTAKVRFSWKQVDYDGGFTLQIAGDGEFKNIVAEKSLKGFFAEIPDLRRGMYHWRVIMNDEDGSVMMKSAHRSFVIEDRLRAPIPLAPINNTTIDMSDKKSLSFRWQPVAGADLYRLELFMLKDGREYRIMNRTTKTPYYEMDELYRLDEAKFLWTLRAYDMQDGNILRTSPGAKYYFDIVLSKKMKKPVIRVPKIIMAE